MCPCVVGETQASVFTFHSQRSDLLYEERSEEPRMQDGAETGGWGGVTRRSLLPQPSEVFPGALTALSSPLVQSRADLRLDHRVQECESGTRDLVKTQQSQKLHFLLPLSVYLENGIPV